MHFYAIFFFILPFILNTIPLNKQGCNPRPVNLILRAFRHGNLLQKEGRPASYGSVVFAFFGNLPLIMIQMANNLETGTDLNFVLLAAPVLNLACLFIILPRWYYHLAKYRTRIDCWNSKHSCIHYLVLVWLPLTSFALVMLHLSSEPTNVYRPAWQTHNF
jgi:hypothetical protein